MTLCTSRIRLRTASTALTLCALMIWTAHAQVPTSVSASGMNVGQGQPNARQPTDRSPTPVVKAEWPVLPGTDGKGPDEAFLVTSITIDGLEKAGLTEEEVGGAEIEMDDRPPAWGRPMARKVTLGALAKPVSPLCLYRGEMERISRSLVKAISDRGFAGISVQFADPLHPADGAIRVAVSLAMIAEIRIDDRRISRTREADPDSIRKECPFKVGEYLRPSTLDSCRELLAARLHTDVDIAISAKERQEPERVVLTIILKPAKGK